MAANLISTISQILTPDLLKRIASALGLEKQQVEKAVSAAVPGLLAAFTSRAETREGSDALNRAVASQQPGLLTSLANAVGGANQSTLIDTGIRTLGSLLGGSGLSTLTNAVARYSGIGDTSSRSLMGILGPLVMGALGEQQRNTGVGVSQLLVSQKDNIVRALPRDFTDLIEGTTVLSDAPSASGISRSGAAARSSASKAATSSWWMIPALAVVALAGAWYVANNAGENRTAEAPAPQKTAEAPAAPAKPSNIPTETGALKSVEIDPAKSFNSLTGIKVGDVDLGTQLTTAVNRLRSSIDGIKDQGTAEMAIPALTDAEREFQRVSGLINQLSPEVRRNLASAISNVRPAIDDMLNKTLAIPGVAKVIQPTVDTIRTELNTLAMA